MVKKRKDEERRESLCMGECGHATWRGIGLQDEW